MSLGDLPDLGRVGKRIGKRLRDIIIPHVDHGPSKEDRLAQRLRDSLKGLVYFDNFDEIEDWKVEEVDPVQQANTPLVERTASQIYDQDGATSRVLLCHDYSGGYHEWEGVRPSPVHVKQASCRYLQFVEFFVYFSHKIVCIPPASWINTCHRNGVKVLGTFIVEGDGKSKSIGRMFDQLDGEFVVAKQLACMARAYGFDGWLLNIEAEFPYAVQHPISNLTGFIRSLKRQLGHDGIVVWYDAITKDNVVDYQNGLTWKNVEFGLAADLFFTNYKWDISELHKSRAVAEQHGIKPTEVYFGIDCWAQNTNMPGPPRVTYPPKGGGGTLTGLGTHTIAYNGFSTAIFGPGWPYEHFLSSMDVISSISAEPQKGNEVQSDEQPRPSEAILTEAEAVDSSMWEGTCLPDELSCNCTKGHPHHRAGYRDMPIMKAAREYPAGSSSYLETNFQQAFCPAPGSTDSISCSENVHSHASDCSPQLWKHRTWNPKLGLQSIMPHITLKQQDDPVSRLYGRLKSGEHPHLHIYLVQPITSSSSLDGVKLHDHITDARLCLFKLNLATATRLKVRAYLKFHSPAERHLVVGFYTKAIVQDSGEVEDAKYEVSQRDKLESDPVDFNLTQTNSNGRIVELGLYCESQSAGPDTMDVLDLCQLIIRPTTEASNPYFIENIEIIHRSSGTNSERRLRWTWRGSRVGWPVGLPWSDTTGPFSVFSIRVDGVEIGHAHCLEFPLRAHDAHKPDLGEVKIEVQGSLFGGGEVLSSSLAKLSSV